MTDTFELTLNNPLTEEQWDQITDVDFDHTDRIWFHTKHGKEVEFAKVIRCKGCKRNGTTLCPMLFTEMKDTDYCSYAEREEK